MKMLPMMTDDHAAHDELGSTAGFSQIMEPRYDATGPTRAATVLVHPGRETRPCSADPVDRPDRCTSSQLEVPITWLELTPPSGSLHLKLMETRGTYRADVWSSQMSPDEQMAWASSQGAWNIRGRYLAGSFVVSFTVDSPPAGPAWLAQRGSYQRFDLHPDGKVHLHLSGPRQDILEVHRRLHQATDVQVVRIADGKEAVMPVLDAR